MKKVIIVSPAHPLRGGIATFGERLATALQEAGYELTIYTFSLQYPNFLFPGKTQFSEDEAPEQLHIKVRINSINPLNWVKVGLAIQKEKADLVIMAFWLPFMGPSIGTIARLAKRNRHSKVIALIHNLIPHEKRIGDTLFTNYFIRPMDACLTLSEAVAEQTRQFTDKPVAVTPHPIYDNYGELVSSSIAKAQLGLKPDENYILFFGFIRDYKGLDLLLQAMADKRLQGGLCKLIIAGEYYGNQPYYEQLINDLGIEDLLIQHTDYISAKDIKYYFGAADLVVQPYRRATQSGISQIAYHFEKPMIVTRVGGLPEIVANGEAGYIVEVDPESIATAIWDFFTQDRKAELVAGVQRNKQRYSWENMVEAIKGLVLV